MPESIPPIPAEVFPEYVLGYCQAVITTAIKKLKGKPRDVSEAIWALEAGLAMCQRHKALKKKYRRQP